LFGLRQIPPLVADSNQNVGNVDDDVVHSALDQLAHLTGIVDRPNVHFLAAAVGRANKVIRQAVRPDAERFDIEPADVSEGVRDNESR
jgi:hypothetical protein